ncbi:DNA-processing protein DprA [Clostridium rectalis]|uniref:DNA-processing protein DprA n=1 Tax=Clostridium rectalis TaxID=2040295 RepID=UPI000F62D32A|nr:DNA-processing protein DprA [Clostridium rectalis]
MSKYDIWFSSVRLSTKIKLKIFKKFKHSEAIWKYCMSKEKAFNELEDEKPLKDTLIKYWNEEKIKYYERIIKINSIKIVNYFDVLYPSRLKVYEDSPCILFYRGNIEKLNSTKTVSIVGSRNSSFYGENVTNILGKELSERGISIISGMAKGIDSIAHNSCINNSGFTCAVLGCGVDVIYPKANKNLYNRICNSGCVLSEFIPTTKPYAYNFPLRNRIISALGDLVIIVEANKKSGSLITASYALQQGKEVMAVPGSILSNRSIGTNNLIKDGAYPLTTIEDVFNILKIEYIYKNEEKISFSNNLEKNIYSIIGSNPVHINDILRICNIDIKQLYGVLFELQLKNQITCLSGNYYVRIANSV